MKFVTRKFLQSAKTICSTKHNQSFYKHVKVLSDDKSLAVVKFDKGNGVRVMNKQDYLKKLDTIVDDPSNFSIVERGKRKNAKHPLLKRQEEIKETINEHLKPFISKELLRRIMPRCTNTGKLYGTCKVHKTSHAVRPIVSMVNTPVYELSKYLDSIIKPLIPGKFSISSNAEFIEQLNEFKRKPGDYCMSLDVVSLFTNIPQAETIEIVAEKYIGK